MSVSVSAASFAEGQPIPVEHTEDGSDLSPALTWIAPPGSASFALVVDDPDAPVDEPWVHWIVANIPGSLDALPGGFHEKNAPADAPEGLVHGKNTWGTVGFRGPAPPPGHGVHHYHFKLYALDAVLDVPEGLDTHELNAAMSGHVLGRGLLVGTYQRD